MSAGRRPRGIALVLVLWVLALLTVMALGLTTVQRTETALTRNQIDGARFRALAEAAVNLVALDLLTTPVQAMDADAEEPGLWVPDGQPRALWFDGVALDVTLFNEGSRLDLNGATRDQLAALIELALIDLAGDGEDHDASAPARLADAITDWRDPDDLVQLNGAEDGDYAAAGLAYGARDDAFRSVDELRQVLGMTRPLYQRLAADLTVENPSGRVDEQFASAPVIAALQGLDLEDARLRVEERQQPVVPDASRAPVLNRGGPLYRVRVTLAQGEVARRSMEALVQVTRGGRPPVQVLWRRYGLMSADTRAGE
jgi:general secretion pathway protein K